jgi:dUTP pyrophosphatase
MTIKIINKSDFKLPEYATINSAGMDLRSNEKNFFMGPMERRLVGTGLYLGIPSGYEAQVRPRSGMAYRSGITVLNSPGTIDADYRGEVRVLLVNLSHRVVEIEHGMRIAQMVVAKHEHVEWEDVETLEDTTRGSGGFGSTGEK